MSDKILQESTLTAIGQHTRKVINKDITERKKTSRKKQKDFIDIKNKQLSIRGNKKTILGFAIYTNRVRPMVHGCPCTYQEGKRYKTKRHIVCDRGNDDTKSFTPLTYVPEKILSIHRIFATILNVQYDDITVELPSDRIPRGTIYFPFDVASFVNEDGKWIDNKSPCFTNSSIWKRILCKTVKRGVTYLNPKHMRYKFSIYFIKNPKWENWRDDKDHGYSIKYWNGQLSNFILNCELSYTQNSITIEFQTEQI